MVYNTIQNLLFKLSGWRLLWCRFTGSHTISFHSLLPPRLDYLDVNSSGIHTVLSYYFLSYYLYTLQGR